MPDANEAPDLPAPPGTPVEIEEHPRLSVGLVEGDTLRQFHRVVTPFLLPDGRLVVPVAGAGLIRVFAPDGEFLATLGRPGQGPGEFGDLNAAWPRGDTIEAFDGELLRITRFLPNGSTEVVRLETTGHFPVAVPGYLRDGWVTARVAEAGMGRRDEMVVDHYARDGAHAGEVARVEGMARYSTPAISGPDPLSPKAVFAVGHGAVYVAETLTPRIQVFDSRGSLEREIAWEPDRRWSVGDALQVVIDSAVARVEPGEAAAVRERLEMFPVPDRLSSFWALIPDEMGFVWVRPFDPARNAQALGGFAGAGTGGEWMIFSPEGIRVGSVGVPDDLEPVHIAADAVVGIRRDALEVESVHVHSLDRR